MRRLCVQWIDDATGNVYHTDIVRPLIARDILRREIPGALVGHITYESVRRSNRAVRFSLPGERTILITCEED